MNYKRLHQYYSGRNSCKESRKRGLKKGYYFKINLSSYSWVMEFLPFFRCTFKCKLKRFKLNHNFAFRNKVIRSATKVFHDCFVSNNTLHTECYSGNSGGFREEGVDGNE